MEGLRERLAEIDFDIIDHDELLKLYLEVEDRIPFSRMQLAKFHKINKNNFLRWIAGKKKSLACFYAIRDAFKSMVEDGTWSGYKFEEEGGSKEYSMQDVLILIGERMPEKIVVIDIENILWRRIDYPCMYIAVYTKCKYPKCGGGVIRMVAKTKGPNVADFAICILVAVISERYPGIEVEVITRDHFGQELSSAIGCKIIS